MTNVAEDAAIDLVVEPRETDLGEFTVRRALPAARRRMVGPFIFLDHIGPAVFSPGSGIAVRPHPHIGIATITYLFEGEIVHRDSLGFEQPIRAGAVNLMTAGHGIVHSERAGDDLDETSRLHGIQSWMALPDDEEECEPAFTHFPAADLPEVDVDGCTVRIIMGQRFGEISPVTTYSNTLYMECLVHAGRQITIPSEAEELAAYVVSGTVDIADGSYSGGVLLVAHRGKAMSLQATEDSRVMIIGGEPLGERHIWWNFVSSSRERIEKAKDDWRDGRFDPVPGDDEFIPMPER